MLVFHHLQWRVCSHPSMGGEGLSLVGGSIPCIREVDRHCHSFSHGGTYPFHYPLCLALPIMTQFGEWSHSSWGSLSASASTDIDVIPSAKCTYVFLPRSAVTSYYLRSWPIFCGCSRWMSTAEVVTSHLSIPREALLVGPWVTTLPLFSCGIIFVSPPIEVILHGVGLVHLSHVHDRCLYTREHQPLMHYEKKLVSVEDAWISVLVCHFIRGDVCCNLMHHLPGLFFPPILDLLLSLKSIYLH